VGAVTWGRQQRRPLVIGHRGASAHALENTIAAFRRARADGADGVEFDVLSCRGGEPIVFHDDDLARLAGRPERIADLPLAEVRAVDLGGGERIPTLDETLEETAGLLVNLEIKTAHAIPPAGLVAAVAARVRRHGLGARALVSSFNPIALAALRLRAPEIARALLFHSKQGLPLRRAWPRAAVRPSALHPEHVLAEPGRVAAWHAAGYAVNVWTVDEPARIRALAAGGVDGVITNDPAGARAALKS
jgi:glycerophosphoryl diester phosphodiesterase